MSDMLSPTIEPSSSAASISPPSNLWQLLREACEETRQQLEDYMNDNDGVYAPEEILAMPFIKNRLSKPALLVLIISFL